MPRKRNLLRANCKKFGGRVANGFCKVDGFPMAESELVLGFKPESQDHEMWNPDKFLKLTGWKGEWPWPTFEEGEPPGLDEETVDGLVEAIESDKPIEVPHIDKDFERGFEPRISGGVTWVPSHEGRHRALACKRARNCKRIPVVIFHTREGRVVPRP